MNVKTRSRNHVNPYAASIIVRDIASLLTMSHAVLMSDCEKAARIKGSFISNDQMGLDDFSSSSWVVAVTSRSPMKTGVTIDGVAGDKVETSSSDGYIEDENLDIDLSLNSPRRRRQGSWAQERLVSAIFSHPHPLSQYCLDAYESAREAQQRRSAAEGLLTVVENSSNAMETHMEPWVQHPKRAMVFHGFVDQLLLHSTPLAVVWDILEGLRELCLDSSFAVVRLSTRAMQGILDAYVEFVLHIWDAIGKLAHTPWVLMQAIASHPPPFNAVVGKTTEAVVSGIQSVATGVGSASSFLNFHRMSSKAVQSSTASMMSASNSRNGAGGSSSATSLFRRSRSATAELNKKKQQQSYSTKSAVALNQKLLRRLSSLNSAASVISYRELDDDTAGLSKQAKTRVQRMMHYDVSLRPFVATVQVRSRINMEKEAQKHRLPRSDSVLVGDNIDLNRFSLGSSTVSASTCNASMGEQRLDSRSELQAGDVLLDPWASSPKTNCVTASAGGRENNVSLGNNGENDSVSSPFMCTPQSFPPTPASRRMVLARGTRFADDVVFLARDQLRVHDGLASDNERTREMAMALTQGKRLAVFDADDAIAAGVDLTCGQHVVTKVGTMLYCSTRSMVPVLRNCFVYFEMTVLPRSTTPSHTSTRRPANSAGQGTPSAPSNGQRSLIPPSSMATLSIGLSTKEMPPNTLVGAWKGSVGLYSTGQFLTAGQWCSPIDPASCAYGERATVGCLVCLDDATAFETWDGVMVTAAVTFSVNGRIVSPPVTTVPALGAGGMTMLCGQSAATEVDGLGPGARGVSTSSASWMPSDSRPQLYQPQHPSEHQLVSSHTPPSSSSNPGHSPATPVGSATNPEKTKISMVSSNFGGHGFTARLPQQNPPSLAFTLPLLVPAEEELYPTVTLHSPATAVMSRFSAGDVLATSRSQLGAPEGVTIYAVDGSVVFQ